MRIAIDARTRVGNANGLEHLNGMFISLLLRESEMQSRDLHQLLRDFHERIERGHRILKDHGDAPASNLAHFVFRQQ